MADANLFPIDGQTVSGLAAGVTSATSQAQDLVSLTENQVNNLKKEGSKIAAGAVEEFGGLTNIFSTSSDDAALARQASTSDALSQEFGSQSIISSGNTSDVGSTKAKNKKFKPIPNVLHDYSTYTYSLSLHALTKEEYNTYFGGTLKSYQPKHVLVASAGRRGDDLVRDELWKEDFYFDKLTMETVIGINAKGRGSNVLTVDFTLVEPYGITFLDRLVATADKLKIESHLQIPYVLQIEFFGYDQDNLDPKAIDKTIRHIPIKIVKVDISYNQNGATYNINAVVFNHSAFDPTCVHLPTAVRLGSPSTEQSLFNMIRSTDKEVKKTTAEFNERKAANDIKIVNARNIGGKGDPTHAINNEYNIYGTTFEQEQASAARPPIIGDGKSGLGSILTAYNRYAATISNLEASPYIYNFEIKNAIGETDNKLKNAIILDQPLIALRSRLASSFNDKVRAAIEQEKPGTLDSPIGLDITFPVGTSFIDVLNQLLKCTDYFKQQLIETGIEEKTGGGKNKKENEALTKKLQPLNFFKITTSVTLGEYIPAKKDYQKKINVCLTPYKMYGNRLPFGPTGEPADSDCIKEYNYLFTGKNQDIIDLKIEYLAAFYTTLTPSAYRYGQDVDRPAVQHKDGDPNVEKIKIQYESLYSGTTQLIPMASLSDNQTQTDAFTIRANDLFQNIYSASKADMLAIDLTILGDPSFIQEQEIAYAYEVEDKVVDPSEPRLFRSGSLIVNNNELLVKLNFKFTNDIDTETGLYTYADKSLGIEARHFTGIYRVLTITNIFEKGLFTQKLNLVRVFNDKNSRRQISNNPNPRPNADALFTGEDAQIQTAQLSRPDALDIPLKSSVASKLPSVSKTVKSAQDQLANNLNEYIAQQTKLGTPVQSADGSETGLDNAGVVNTVEQARIKQAKSQNDADNDVGDGDTG